MTEVPGCFGKIPSLGDFLRRRLPEGFVGPWDQWLQQAIQRSREQLAHDWLAIYLTSPLWRFALAPGLCGDRPWLGVLMPSVDRVGRYYPLTLAAAPASGGGLQDALARNPDWFQGLERLALSTLEDPFDLEAFDQGLVALGPPAVDVLPPIPLAKAGESGPWRMEREDLEPTDGPDRQPAGLGSLWWSRGSERVRPSLLGCPGLPPVAGFAALLAGDWAHWGWRDGPIGSEASLSERLGILDGTVP